MTTKLDPRIKTRLVIRCKGCRSKTTRWTFFNMKHLCPNCLKKEQRLFKEVKLTAKDLEYRTALRKAKGLL